MNPLTYAIECAAANPSRDNAILCLRNLVERDGWPYKAALQNIYAAFPLGLAEIAEISTEAQKRYAPKVPA